MPILLGPDDPPPVIVDHENGASPYVICCDHAGRRFPKKLGQLGLPDSETMRHIAWDIGIHAIGGMLAQALDATVIRTVYSRLVIDCNRTPGVESSMPEISESTVVPGNFGISDAERQARIDEIFRPYHNRIEAELDRRRDTGRAAAIVALHSFTPVYKGISRPWHTGVLYNRDPRFAHLLMRLLQNEPGLVVGDNEPYSVTDASDYTIPVHGEQRGLHHIAIEIRQDLVADAAGQQEWADRLARLLPQAYRQMLANDAERATRAVVRET